MSIKISAADKKAVERVLRAHSEWFLCNAEGDVDVDLDYYAGEWRVTRCYEDRGKPYPTFAKAWKEFSK